MHDSPSSSHDLDDAFADQPTGQRRGEVLDFDPTRRRKAPHEIFRELDGQTLPFQQALEQLSTLLRCSYADIARALPELGSISSAELVEENVRLSFELITDTGLRDALSHQYYRTRRKFEGMGMSRDGSKRVQREDAHHLERQVEITRQDGPFLRITAHFEKAHEQIKDWSLELGYAKVDREGHAALSERAPYY
jgi:hypothetical protein